MTFLLDMKERKKVRKKEKKETKRNIIFDKKKRRKSLSSITIDTSISVIGKQMNREGKKEKMIMYYTSLYIVVGHRLRRLFNFFLFSLRAERGKRTVDRSFRDIFERTDRYSRFSDW